MNSSVIFVSVPTDPRLQEPRHVSGTPTSHPARNPQPPKLEPTRPPSNPCEYLHKATHFAQMLAELQARPKTQTAQPTPPLPPEKRLRMENPHTPIPQPPPRNLIPPHPPPQPATLHIQPGTQPPTPQAQPRAAQPKPPHPTPPSQDADATMAEDSTTGKSTSTSRRSPTCAARRLAKKLLHNTKQQTALGEGGERTAA